MVISSDAKYNYVSESLSSSSSSSLESTESSLWGFWQLTVSSTICWQGHAAVHVCSNLEHLQLSMQISLQSQIISFNNSGAASPWVISTGVMLPEDCSLLHPNWYKSMWLGPASSACFQIWSWRQALFMWHKKLSSVGGSFLGLIFLVAFSHLRIFLRKEVLVLLHTS